MARGPSDALARRHLEANSRGPHPRGPRQRGRRPSPVLAKQRRRGERRAWTTTQDQLSCSPWSKAVVRPRESMATLALLRKRASKYIFQRCLNTTLTAGYLFRLPPRTRGYRKKSGGWREGGRGASATASVPFLVRFRTPPSNIPFKVACGEGARIRLASTRGVRFEAKTSPRVR